EFRLNYSSNDRTHRNSIEVLGGSQPVDLQQLTGLGANSEVSVNFSTPTHSTGLFQGPESGAQKQWNVVDTLDLSAGSHQLTFGVDYRRLTPFAILSNPAAAYDFNNQQSIQGNNADFVDWQAYLPAYPLYTNFSVFAQDN